MNKSRRALYPITLGLASALIACASSAYAIEPIDVIASSDDGNVPENTLDNDLSSRWSGNGDGVWIEYDFGQTVNLSAIEIALYKGDQRRANFDVQSSTDGNTWQSQFSITSSGNTTNLESYALYSDMQYVRIVGYGNTSNSWTSITEVNFVEFDTPQPTPTPETTPTATPSPEPVDGLLPIIAVDASSNDGNGPENTLDGSLSTRWSANGDGQTITYDLGNLYVLESAGIAFYKGNSRTTSFTLQVGPDGTHFTTVYSGDSTGDSTALETFDVVDMPARYVQIIGHGNSSNSWTSLTEVELYGHGNVTDVAPVALFNTDDMVTTEIPLTLDGSASFDPDGGGITSYFWDFGDGATATGAVVNHTYSLGGEFAISLTVSDDEGESHSVTHTLVVDDGKEPPVAVISAPASGKPGDLINIDASGSFDPDGGNITSYNWSFDDGTSSNAASLQKAFSGEGNFVITLTVTDDEGAQATKSQSIFISSIDDDALWALHNPSFEESSSYGGWIEEDPANVVSTNGTSNPMPVDGGRLLVIDGSGGLMKQAIYKPIAGHVYRASAWVYGHGTIGIQDIGSDVVYQTTSNHGDTWQQIFVDYTSTGSPAFIYAQYGSGSGDAYFDMFDVRDISTADDLAQTPTAPIMRYPSQVLDLQWWKITMPINNAEEHYCPELLTMEIGEYFKLVHDEDGYAVQFRANHGGSTTGGSSNPRSELRELTQNYHYQNSKSAASWSNTSGVHEMWIKQKVTHLTSVKPHVVVGQIHDSGDDVVVFRVEGHNGICPEGTENDWGNCGTPGELDTHANIWLTDGNTTHAYLLDDNYELGTVFTVKFIAANGEVNFEYNGQAVDYTHHESFSGAYFKLGNYTQSHSGTAPNESDDAYAETYVYDYYIKHSE